MVTNRGTARATRIASVPRILVWCRTHHKSRNAGGIGRRRGAKLNDSRSSLVERRVVSEDPGDRQHQQQSFESSQIKRKVEPDEGFDYSEQDS